MIAGRYIPMGKPYFAVRILHNLPRGEQLSDCSMCMEDRVRMVQLGVIGHQVALCAPCLRHILKFVAIVGEVTP